MSIISQWSHNSQSLGPVPPGNDPANDWRTFTHGDIRVQEISDANSLYPGGGRYYHTVMRYTAKEMLNCERRPRFDPENTLMQSLGGGEWAMPHPLWYGFWARQDLSDDIYSQFVQWHNTEGGQGKSPPLSVLGDATGPRIRLEKNRDNNDKDFRTDYLLPNGQWLRVPHCWVWQIQWDTRPKNNGGKGFVRCWIDGAQVLERFSSNCHEGASTNGKIPYFKWGGYKSRYQYGSHQPNGALTEASYDLLTYGDEDETLATMLEACHFDGAAPPIEPPVEPPIDPPPIDPPPVDPGLEARVAILEGKVAALETEVARLGTARITYGV